MASQAARPRVDDQPAQAIQIRSSSLAACFTPGVMKRFLSPRSVLEARVSAGRRRTAEPRVRAKVSSNGVELVLACAPNDAENAIPAQGRPTRPARSGAMASRKASGDPPSKKVKWKRNRPGFARGKRRPVSSHSGGPNLVASRFSTGDRRLRGDEGFYSATRGKNFFQTRRGTLAQRRKRLKYPRSAWSVKRKTQVRSLLKTTAGLRLNWRSGMG